MGQGGGGQRVDFFEIRPSPNGQSDSFEELVCQIARVMDCGDAGEFRRIRGSGGDGGVECVWSTSDGEVAWQAKYFKTIGEAQWRQIDRSVESAISNYPRLTRYVVALPIDLGGPVGKRSGAWDKWTERVARWNELLGDRSVRFEVKSASELSDFLIRMESGHPGYLKYWFGVECLGPSWVKTSFDRLTSCFRSAHNPLIHVDTHLSRLLNAYAGGTDWMVKIVSSMSPVIDELNVYAAMVRVVLGDGNEIAVKFSESLGDLIQSIADVGGRHPSHIYAQIKMIESVVSRAVPCVHEVDRRSKYRSDRCVSAGERCLDSIYDVAESCVWMESMPDDSRFLVVAGDAGSGKTHQLVELAMKSLSETDDMGLVVFASGVGVEGAGLAAMDSIAADAGFTGGFTELLTAMDAESERRGLPSVLVVDALNESPSPGVWRELVLLLFKMTGRCTNLRVIVSVRGEVECDLLPEGLLEEPGVSRYWNDGFVSVRDEALDAYCSHYGVERVVPSSIRHIADSPLLLKLYCETKRGRPFSSGHSGSREMGIPGLIGEWIRHLQRGAIADRMGIDPRGGLVEDGVLILAKEMFDSGQLHVSRDRASILLNQLVPGMDYRRGLLCALLEEGVLRAVGPGLGEVAFSFERLAEWALARYVLARWVDNDIDPGDVWRMYSGYQSPLSSDEIGANGSLFSSPGVMSQMIVMYADIHGREMWQTGPDDEVVSMFGRTLSAAMAWGVEWAIGEGIVWRGESAMSAELSSWIDARLSRCDLFVWDQVIRSSCVPNHPLRSSGWLDGKLLGLGMLARDAFWSAPVGWLYDPNRLDSYSHRPLGPQDDRVVLGACRELVDWSISSDLSLLPEESLMESARVLCWFLSSSHRVLRDRATHGLRRHVESCPMLSDELLNVFSSCGDPYIFERVLAAIYGAGLKGAHECLTSIRRCWDDEIIPDELWSDVVVRDYITSSFLAPLAGGPLRMSRQVPVLMDPFEAELSESYVRELRERLSGEEFRGSIPMVEGSLFDLTGDFGNYTISCLREFSSVLLGDDFPVRSAEIQDLPGAVLEYTSKMSGSDGYLDVNQLISEYLECDAADELTRGRCMELLGGVKLSVPVGDDQIKLWIFNYVLTLWSECGPDLSVVDQYDSSWPSLGRDSHKPERIGKKYQWLAMRELVSALCDTHRTCECGGGKSAGRADVWMVPLRHLDPCLDETLRRDDRVLSASPLRVDPWWQCLNVPVDSLGDDGSADEWRATAGMCLLNPWAPTCFSPEGNSEWVNVSQNCRVVGNRMTGDFMAERYVTVGHAGYLVRDCDVDEAVQWLSERSFMNRSLFDGGGIILHGSIGEWPWHPRFGHGSEGVPDYVFSGSGRWCESGPGGYSACVQFLNEGGYDCSRDDSISIPAPGRVFTESTLAPSWRGVPGQYWYCDELAFMDPSLDAESGPNAFLVSRRYLDSFLVRTKMSLLTVCIAEWFHSSEGHVRPEGEEVAWGVTCLVGRLSGDGSASGYARHYALMIGTGEILKGECCW